MSFARAFAPFRARNFLKFWIGQGISQCGNWFTATAVNWHVYALTRSVVAQGWMSFAQQSPTTFLAPLAGVLADRADRRNFLLGVQYAGMAASAGLTLFAVFDGVSLPVFGALCALRGVVSSAEVPARQVMMIRFVEDPALLGRAIALNSTLFNLTRFVAPALAGWLYVRGEASLPGLAAGGAAVCFFLDTLTFVPLILLVRGMTLPAGDPVPAGSFRRAAVGELIEGVAYARRHPGMRLLLPAVAAFSMFGLSYTVMLPRIAAEDYAGDSRTYGGFLAAVASGALLAAVSLALVRDSRRLSGRIAFGALAMGAALATLAFTPPPPWVYPALAVAGLGGVTVMAGVNTLIQTSVEERFRGRALGLFHMCFSGMLPFGALFSGYMTDRFGLRAAMLFASFASLGVAARIASDRKRPATGCGDAGKGFS